MVWTGGKSRDIMFSLLDDYVKNHKDSFVGHNVIDDLMKLVRIRSKIQALSGAHDDSIMSFLMCLYVYYYGNNLARYGFTRGGIPDEEDRNQGMNYHEIINELSETDKQFLGITSDPLSQQPLELDMMSMINNARGLISKEELQQEMSNSNSLIKKIKTPTMDPYTAKIHNDMMKAQRESEAFNRRVGFSTGYHNIDEDTNEDIGFNLDLFDELNM